MVLNAVFPAKPIKKPRSGDELQTLSRGLRALAFLNRNGPTTLAVLSRELDVPRPTAYRVITTLMSEGYCRRIPNSRLYLVSTEVAGLSNGMSDADLLTNIAMDPMGRMGKQLKWPVALAVPDACDMLVRLASDLSTPLALAKIAPGYRAPMLSTTTGILYLALSPDAVGEALLRRIAIVTKGNVDSFRSDAELGRLFTQARQDGYLIEDLHYSEASIGVPVLSQGQPVAGIVMRYIKSSISKRQIITRCLPELLATASSIGEEFTQAHSSLWRPVR